MTNAPRSGRAAPALPHWLRSAALSLLLISFLLLCGCSGKAASPSVSETAAPQAAELRLRLRPFAAILHGRLDPASFLSPDADICGAQLRTEPEIDLSVRGRFTVTVIASVDGRDLAEQTTELLVCDDILDLELLSGGYSVPSLLPGLGRRGFDKLFDIDHGGLALSLLLPLDQSDAFRVQLGQQTHGFVMAAAQVLRDIVERVVNIHAVKIVIPPFLATQKMKTCLTVRHIYRQQKRPLHTMMWKRPFLYSIQV